jgi:hypothetical protein
MTDSKLDPAVLAIQLAETKGDVQSLQQALANATQNFGSTLQSVQIDIRSISQKMDGMATLSARQETMDDEIERAFTAIEKLAESSKEKWDQHYEEQSGYRATRDGEIRASREKLILWGGVCLGFSVLAATLTAIVAWSVNSRFTAQENALGKLDLRLDKHIEKSTEDHEQAAVRIEKVEKYLIRGGRAPAEPYEESK